MMLSRASIITFKGAIFLEKKWILVLIGMLSPLKGIEYIPRNNVNTKIVIVQGDITQQSGIDAIVNAANEGLNHAGGVAWAINTAAGKQLQHYCNQLPFNGNNRCNIGDAVITPAFDLEKIGIKYIIHTVGPRIVPGSTITQTDEKNLYNAYKHALMRAQENKVRRVAFPAISTAIFGYDINKATPIAFRALSDFIQENSDALDEIRVVLFSQTDFNIYKKVADRFFSSPKVTPSLSFISQNMVEKKGKERILTNNTTPRKVLFLPDRSFLYYALGIGCIVIASLIINHILQV